MLSGQSVFLQGFGGTGRTFAAKQIAKELLEQKKQVVCTSYTHMASQNIAMPGAMNGTLHHCLHKLPIRYDKFDKMHVIGWPKINPEVGNLILDHKRKNMKYIK